MDRSRAGADARPWRAASADRRGGRVVEALNLRGARPHRARPANGRMKTTTSSPMARSSAASSAPLLHPSARSATNRRARPRWRRSRRVGGGECRCPIGHPGRAFIFWTPSPAAFCVTSFTLAVSHRAQCTYRGWISWSSSEP
jgi:hypothetical protein